MTPLEQMALAQDESTPESVLLEIWNGTTAVIIRKTIAKNPNAGVDLLKVAARLYMEEVIKNPMFSMLEIFCEDPWIKLISDAYRDPEQIPYWINSAVLGLSCQKQLIQDTCYAAFLSPQLTPCALNLIVRDYAVSNTFRRALKNPEVLNRIKSLFEKSLEAELTWPFCLETVLILHREKVISFEELYIALSNYGVASSSAGKSIVLPFLKTYSNFENLLI